MIKFTYTRTAPPRATRIRIVRVPSGDAPGEVREAWVGVELPLLRPGLYKAKVNGLLSPTRGRFEDWIRRRLGITKSRVGYLVEAGPAVEELSRHNPSAARWFRETVPQLLEPGKLFVFEVEVCRTVETE